MRVSPLSLHVNVLLSKVVSTLACVVNARLAWQQWSRRCRAAEEEEEDEEEEEEEEVGLFKADAVNEEDPERDRATQVWRRRRGQRRSLLAFLSQLL